MPLPDLNEEKPDDHFFGADPTLWSTAELSSEETLSSEELIPYEAPLYQNQMDDPEVRAEFDRWWSEI